MLSLAATSDPSLIDPRLFRLGREIGQACAQATQPEEIAAALESIGMNDELARERYGYASVFACAEALFVQFPYKGGARERGKPERLAWNFLGRGLLYAMPGAALTAAALGLRGASGVQLALFTAVVFGWGWSQGMASVGYALSGAPQQRFLRLATLLAAPAAALLCAVPAALLGAPVLVAAGAGALSALALTAFGALLVMRQPLLAFVPYLPSLVYCAAVALRWPLAPAAHILWAVLGCAALPVIALFSKLPLTDGPTGPRPPLSRALAHAWSGWSCAVFVTAAFGSALLRDLGSSALLPVIASIGVMEVLMLAYQNVLRRAAARFGDLRLLALVSFLVLAGLVLAYAGALSALIAAFLLVTIPGGLPTLLAPGALAPPLVVYGCALLLGAILGNFGWAWAPGLAWLVGSLTFLTFHALHLSSAALVSASAALLVLLLGVLYALLVPTTYR